MVHGDKPCLSELAVRGDPLIAQALSTWITCDGIEACRRGCGGHGYSLLSGLPTLYASYVQNATWEGDNNVLCLQVRLCNVTTEQPSLLPLHMFVVKRPSAASCCT